MSVFLGTFSGAPLFLKSIYGAVVPPRCPTTTPLVGIHALKLLIV